MTLDQLDLRGLQLNDPEILARVDSYEHIVLHRLHPASPRLRAMMEDIRPIEPIVSFDNQVALPLFWYEFPLRTEQFDPEDPLTHRRSLYRWQDVREAILSSAARPK